MAELTGALQKRHTLVEGGGQVWESQPAPSSADACSHFEGISIGSAPSAQEWMSTLNVEEEDPLQDAFAALLKSRGPCPAHAPAEAEDPRSAAQAITELQGQLEADSQNLGLRREELVRREAEVSAREKRLEEEIDEAEREKAAQRDYPRPAWFRDSRGTLNVGVVGNSGVGKSLLINRLRNLQRYQKDWAAVGVKETTKSARMYRLPGDKRVRLWDLPGAGTEGFPLETYIRTMGLRYFDSVLIVTAGRFTTTEIQLRRELQEHGVPFRMVRTKVDIDVWNNQMDNGLPPAMTLQQIRDEFKQQHGVREDLYLISSRYPEQYDMQRLRLDAFPGLSCHVDKDSMLFADGWGGGWALPNAHSELLSPIQGHWQDKQDGMQYIVEGSQVHLTFRDGRAALVQLVENDGKIWLNQTWSFGRESVVSARRSGELRWAPKDLRVPPLVWCWLS